jgi:hypothetical protein
LKYAVNNGLAERARRSKLAWGLEVKEWINSLGR